MLVLTRKSGEQILIGDDIVITVLEGRGDGVRIGIDAPRGVKIQRQEVLRAVEEANVAAADTAPTPKSASRPCSPRGSRHPSLPHRSKIREGLRWPLALSGGWKRQATTRATALAVLGACLAVSHTSGPGGHLLIHATKNPLRTLRFSGDFRFLLWSLLPESNWRPSHYE